MKACMTVLSVTMLLVILSHMNTALAQRLPEGEFHPNRERVVDILHYRADLELNWNEKTVSGAAEVVLHPLRRLDALSLDAIRLTIESVQLQQKDGPVGLLFSTGKNSLQIALDRVYSPSDTLALLIRYAAAPNAGMYFQPDPDHPEQMFVYTYGEGGLHANWLPIYNDVNDKFSSEMRVTAPLPYTVISNGALLGIEATGDGKRAFHYKQSLPHPNYLIALYAGEFEKGDLPPAFGGIPLAYWVPKGRLAEGAYAFRNTPRMVEFFSRRLHYRYPWDKYDQVAVPDYSLGAMEHTSVTGHRASVLRDASVPDDFGGPDFDYYYNVWTAEGTISHELAHHWFGDNITCKNLGNIWLNESFATYLQFLWDEESLGRETLLLDCQTALDRYLEYVKKERLIRPLEYHYFDKTSDIYNEEHTYLKGAMVLHCLRRVLGDEPFFKTCSYFLRRGEFSNVDSRDFAAAIEAVTGRNLDWFFDDWIYGAGHPVFEISYSYLPDRQLLALTIKQVQPLVEGQGLFTLPVEVAIVTAGKTERRTFWVDEAEEEFIIECEQKPLMVSFDGAGNLVAEIRFEKSIDELAYQIEHDEFPGRIRAMREAARRFPGHPRTLAALSGVLSGSAFWALKAEAALLLGQIRTSEAEKVMAKALQQPDYRVRKAAALGLAQFPPQFAAPLLKNLIEKDSHSDVASTALKALAKNRPAGAAPIIRKHIDRPAWYREITLAALEGFGEIGDPALAAEIRPYTGENYHQHIRTAALNAWKSCAPADPQLHAALIDFAANANYGVKMEAIKLLGQLRVRGGEAVLKQINEESGDVNFRVEAKKALQTIERAR